MESQVIELKAKLDQSQNEVHMLSEEKASIESTLESVQSESPQVTASPEDQATSEESTADGGRQPAL